MDIERTVSLNCVLAAGLWVMMVALLVAGAAVGLTADGQTGEVVSRVLMASGLACSAGAVMFTLTNMLKRQDRMMRQAFQLGQDYEGGVRRVR